MSLSARKSEIHEALVRNDDAIEALGYDRQFCYISNRGPGNFVAAFQEANITGVSEIDVMERALEYSNTLVSLAKNYSTSNGATND